MMTNELMLLAPEAERLSDEWMAALLGGLTTDAVMALMRRTRHYTKLLPPASAPSLLTTHRARRSFGQTMLNSLEIATQALVFLIEISSIATYGAVDPYQTATASFT